MMMTLLQRERDLEIGDRMRQFFIRTRDENTKDILLKNGFTLLHKEGDFYVFINDGTPKFSKDVQKEVFYTDKLNL